MKLKLLLFAFLLVSLNLISKNIPPVPKTFIQDNTGIVEKVYWDSINNLLADLEEQTGTQFIVYVAESLDGEVLETYVNKMYNAWELGGKGKDNGILLAVFIKDHSFRIEIGYGLEGRIPDLLSYKYQETYMVPQFKEGNYGKGILECSKALADAASDFLWDFFGEKKQREIDSLVIRDDTKTLSMENKTKIISELKYGYSYLSYLPDRNFYYYISPSADSMVIKENLTAIWDKIQKQQAFVQNKVLIGVSASRPFYITIADKTLLAELETGVVKDIMNDDFNSFIDQEWSNKEYYYILYNIRSQIEGEIDFSRFKKNHPVYMAIFPIFIESRYSLMYKYDELIAFSIIFLALILPILFIIIFTLANRSLEPKTKKILIAWSFLNYLLPFLGYIVQLFLIAKVIKLFRKKGNYLDKIRIINEKSYFGYLIEFLTSKGGGGSYTYSSSGSSYSSGSYSSGSSYSSSSSSSSSSSRSFGGGGGGRSGGGGSSGKW